MLVRFPSTVTCDRWNQNLLCRIYRSEENDLSCSVSGHEGVTQHRLADCQDQIGRKAGFEDIAAGSCRKRRRNKIRIFMNGQEYDFGATIRVPQRFRSLKSIQDRHRDIDHQYIRLPEAHGIDGLVAIVHGRNNFKIRT